ncbi:hypothetical protein HNE_3042 [Hyphomonas neptunium ATCC 15444]|uniref:Uncharacterized protein n=1 Tax=Hyphomonas neptunium (strain ATCC 15444) TaxID=228405 RepID=Q0BXS4_HYPNA|nr:hypothetical protein HNE_3042 [Hyphomonas neptunium ATCC 15444]
MFEQFRQPALIIRESKVAEFVCSIRVLLYVLDKFVCWPKIPFCQAHSLLEELLF